MIPSNLLPEGSKWCVAGGYAACPALAGDTDIWVMVETDLFGAYELLVHHLKQQVDDEWLIIAPRPDAAGADFVVHQLYVDEATVKVAQLYTDGRQFHIMLTYLNSPESIIGRFDISTHQVALTATGRVVTGPEWTPVSVPPVVSRHTGDRTTARLAKIQQRYGHDVTS